MILDCVMLIIKTSIPMQYCETVGHFDTDSFRWQAVPTSHHRNESHLSGVLGTNRHAKFSPNEGVIDEVCNILKVLSIILTEREETGKRIFRVWCGKPARLLGLYSPFVTFSVRVELA